jgi:hypothetical protein
MFPERGGPQGKMRPYCPTSKSAPKSHVRKGLLGCKLDRIEVSPTETIRPPRVTKFTRQWTPNS